jgi:hypothetical protein
MQGRLQAIMVASSLVLLSLIMPPLVKPVVIIVSFATIALVTLRKGFLEGLYVLLFSSVAAALLGALLVWQYQFALLMLVSCLIMWLPVWLIALILREGRYLALAIELPIWLSVIGVVGFYLYATDPDPSTIWKNMFAPLFDMLPKEAPVDNIRSMVDISSHYMTGAVAASSLFSSLFGLFLGRWWQSILYNPGGFKQEFLSLTTRPRLAISCLIVVIVAWASSGIVSEIAWNVSIVFSLLYIYIGIAVLHTLFAAMKKGNYIVPMFYVTLFLIPHILLLVALVGLSDAWLNLRKIKSNQHTPDGV